jgi:hypothetical protein
VVRVDVEVARRRDRQVEAAMPREQLEHVIEEADAGPHLVAAAAVEIDLQPDLRFRGPPVNSRATQGCPPGPRASSRCDRRCRP